MGRDRPIRVANCVGWLWDRFSGLRDALAGPVDVVTGDYLAEPTLRQLALERAQDPRLGYARSFLAQFTDAVGLLAERGARLVVDAGGLNPAGLADESAGWSPTPGWTSPSRTSRATTSPPASRISARSSTSTPASPSPTPGSRRPRPTPTSAAGASPRRSRAAPTS